MPRRRFLILIRSILVGWVMFVPLTYLVARPILLWMAPWLGAAWLPTAQLSLDCLALAAAGFGIGRLHRSAPVSGALAFAATLCFFNLDPFLPINVPWLIRLAADAFHDTRYWGALEATALQHLFLFGSLILGALVSRRSAQPLSIFGGSRR